MSSRGLRSCSLNGARNKFRGLRRRFRRALGTGTTVGLGRLNLSELFFAKSNRFEAKQYEFPFRKSPPRSSDAPRGFLLSVSVCRFRATRRNAVCVTGSVLYGVFTHKSREVLTSQRFAQSANFALIKVDFSLFSIAFCHARFDRCLRRLFGRANREIPSLMGFHACFS